MTELKDKRNKRKKSRFRGAVSRNAARQRQGRGMQHLQLPRGVPIFREEPKTRVDLDIIPYVVTDPNHPDKDEEFGIAVKGELWYKRPYYLHRGIGPNNDSIVCPTSVGKKCPICEYRANLLKEGADWNDESVRALKPSLRNLYVVIPRKHKHYEEVPHIWDISQFLFQDRLNEEIEEDETYETFPDLEEGFTLRIRFSEEQFGTNKYAGVSRIDFYERKKPIPESILDEVPNLDEVLVILSYESIERLFFGGDVAEDNDDDAGIVYRRPSRRVEDEDSFDDDEDDDLFEDDEDEQDEDLFEDDEDEDDEDEDDEDEDDEDDDPSEDDEDEQDEDLFEDDEDDDPFEDDEDDDDDLPFDTSDDDEEVKPRRRRR